jgi:uncharacterized protein YjbI with pentapeptide repeats
VDLKEAHLEGVLMHEAKLQGASLDRAQLQGASLDWADLQGASLVGAQLQGASLVYVELQGASLEGAQLQGAQLGGAQLQGASLVWAKLQGVSLNGAELQGASLDGANLQGASLDRAAVNAADFSYAFLWRTNWGNLGPAEFVAVRLEMVTWNPEWAPKGDPVPWTDKAYAELRDLMTNSIPEGEMRNNALERIETLDCANANEPLASRDPAAEVLDWQKKLAAAGADDVAYAKALATELRSLVCASDANAIHILRGVVRGVLEPDRLTSTGREAPALVDYIMSKDCPVSASLTDDDKAKLLKIKQEAEKESAPPPASKK